jgi:hypothetical protein
LCRFWLPPVVINDIDKFMEDTKIYPMDGSTRTASLVANMKLLLMVLKYDGCDRQSRTPQTFLIGYPRWLPDIPGISHFTSFTFA